MNFLLWTPLTYPTRVSHKKTNLFIDLSYIEYEAEDEEESTGKSSGSGRARDEEGEHTFDADFIDDPSISDYEVLPFDDFY